MPATDPQPDRPLPALPHLRGDTAVIARPRQPLLLAGSACHVVTVLSPPPGLTAWLHGLDGTQPLEAALLAAPLPTEAARYLLQELDRAGLLGDGNAGRSFADPAHYQRDALRLADRARDGALPVAPATHPLPVALRGAAQWVRPLGTALSGCASHVALVAADQARLVVDIDTAFATPGVADRGALLADAAKLRVAISAFDALFSPLSLPGQTACPRCWSLQTDVRQPDWEDWLYAGRCPQPPHVPTHHRALITAVAVEHILTAAAVLRGAALPDAAARDRRIDLRAGTVSSAPVAAHPACGCIRRAA